MMISYSDLVAMFIKCFVSNFVNNSEEESCEGSHLIQCPATLPVQLGHMAVTPWRPPSGKAALIYDQKYFDYSNR